MSDMASTLRVLLPAALMLAVCGCGSGDEPAPPEKEQDAVVRRMEDPAYVKQIQGKIDERRDIMKSMADAKRRLDAAKAAGASEEELAPIAAEIEAGKKAIKDNKAAAERMVRDRILADNAAANDNLKKKGE